MRLEAHKNNLSLAIMPNIISQKQGIFCFYSLTLGRRG
jgi:hypothetical protein